MAEFSWAAAADVGLGLLGGAGKALGAAGSALMGRANAKAAKDIRDANNTVARSARNLAGTVRSINDDRIMAAAGAQLDTLTKNAVRTGDSFARGKFEQSVRDAEQWGQAAAGAAAAGLGGAGVRAIGMVNSLQIARRKEQLESREGEFTADQTDNAGVMANALRRLDQSPLTARQDWSTGPAAPSTNWSGFLLDGLLSKKDSLNVLAGSLYSQPAAVGEAPSAQTSPVADSVVKGTPLASFQFDVSPYEDTDRFYNRSPPPYADEQRMLNRSQSLN